MAVLTAQERRFHFPALCAHLPELRKHICTKVESRKQPMALS